MKQTVCSRLFLLLFFPLISSYAREFTVPPSWEPIAESQDGIIVSIGIQDGWIAWMENRGDPATAMNRAPSSFVGLYRKQLGTDAIETLLKPDESRPWGDQFVLGEKGIVASDYRGAFQQILYPRKPRPPVFLYPRQERPRNPHGMGNTETVIVMGKGEHTPVRIFTEGLICLYADRNQTRWGVSIIPWNGTEADPVHAEVLAPPNADRFCDGDWKGNYILYSADHTLRLYNKQTGKHDFTFRTKDRLEYFTHVCLDERFVYFYRSDYNCVGFGEIFRFSIDEKTLERMTLPSSFWELIDLTPEQILWISKAGTRQYELFLSNLRTGEIWRYDFSYAAASLSGGGLGFGGLTEHPVFSRGQNLSGDARSGRILISHNNKLYLIPKADKEAKTWPSYGWISAFRQETKDRLDIQDETGKEIQWYSRDPFNAADRPL